MGLEDTDPLTTVAKATSGEINDDEGTTFENLANSSIDSCDGFGWREVVLAKFLRSCLISGSLDCSITCSIHWKVLIASSYRFAP